MQEEFLTTQELADRWKIAYKTICNWRCSGIGPKFHKIGSRISYRREDIEQFESSRCCQNTSEYLLKALKGNQKNKWASRK